MLKMKENLIKFWTVYLERSNICLATCILFNLRNGVKITSQFQANYFGVSQLSFEANSSAI